MVNVPYSLNKEVELITNDSSFEMRKSDWERIKRYVNKLPKQNKFLSNLYSIFLGAGFSGVLVLISLINSQNLKPWIIPTYIIFTISCFILGGVILYLDVNYSKKLKETKDELATEICEIEKLYSK
mgnify:CR=1 FL=1